MKSLFCQLALVCLLAAALAVGSCQRPSGPPFAGLHPTAAGCADLYLYRRDAYAAIGQSFTVAIDGKRAGKLYNASYLKLTLAPGPHRLEVAPGGSARPVGASVMLDADRRAFYEFSFATGWEMRPSFPGAAIAPRNEGAALPVLATLRSAH
jgi:hypothetical protein